MATKTAPSVSEDHRARTRQVFEDLAKRHALDAEKWARRAEKARYDGLEQTVVDSDEEQAEMFRVLEHFCFAAAACAKHNVSEGDIESLFAAGKSSKKS